MAIVAGSTKLIESARLTSARSLTARSPVPKIEGLVAWYETSRRESFKTNESVGSGQISAWYDISPGSIAKQKNTLARTASSAVTYQRDGINKVPSLYFDGTAKISITNFYQGTSTQNTIFFVAKPYALSGGVNIIDSGVGSTTTIALTPSGMFAFWGVSATISATSCCFSNENYIVAFYANGSSSKAYINNASSMTGGVTFNIGGGSLGSLTGLTVGSTLDNNSDFNGLISEVIIYNRPLQTQERKDVMNYLGQKYGITITGI